MARQAVLSLEDIEQRMSKKAVDKQEKAKNAPPKKEFVVNKGADGLYTVAWEGGGELPDPLKGRFTSVAKINALIDRYKHIKGIKQQQPSA